MARRSKKSDEKLVLLALVLAPILWLHDKIGTTGIVIIVVALLAVIIVATLSGSSKEKKPPKQRGASRPARRTGGTTEFTISIPADKIDNILGALDRMDMTDYLAQAAEAGKKAKTAADGGDFDGAWRFYHEQKSLYAQHANRSEFTATQAIALEGSVHRNLANLLRLEGRHGEALVHYLYYYATSPKRTKTDEKQIKAYANRVNASIDDVQNFVATLDSIPNFRSIQVQCDRWTRPT